MGESRGYLWRWGGKLGELRQEKKKCTKTQEKWVNVKLKGGEGRHSTFTFMTLLPWHQLKLQIWSCCLNLFPLQLKPNPLSFHTTDSTNIDGKLDLELLWKNKMKRNLDHNAVVNTVTVMS